MKTLRIVLLLLSLCAVLVLFTGCDNNRKVVDWDSYDESTTSIYLSNYNLSDEDIAPLENLTGLVKLTITGSRISDLTPLANLTNLRELNLSSNRISDLTPLANLTNLESLYLYNNQISDLTPLSNLTNLTVLSLDSNRVSDLAPLANLTNLTALFLDDNQISDLAPLKNLKNLTRLTVLNNDITDWSYVMHVPDIEGNPADAILLTESTATLKTGQFFYLSFDETQSIPMRWQVVISDESLVRLIGTEVDSSGLSSNAAPGSPGEKRVFYFEALSPGECSIYLYRLDIDEKVDPNQMSPSRSYTFVVEN